MEDLQQFLLVVSAVFLLLGGMLWPLFRARDKGLRLIPELMIKIAAILAVLALIVWALQR